jgi:cytochrome P450
MTEPITGADAVRAALADEEYRMPPVDRSASTGIAWLRASVARFTDGAPHARRRAHVTDLLAAVDPAALRTRARERTAAVLASADGPVDVMSAIARPVPIGVLSAALAVASDLTPAVAAAARSYQPHTPVTAEADAAVAALVAAFGGVADEPTAARISVLVQACDATAGLIGAAIRTGDVETALRDDPPARRTRRVRAGREVQIDLTSVPFGAGPHRCPGSEHATAIVLGVLDALRGWRIVPGSTLMVMASHSVTNT